LWNDPSDADVRKEAGMADKPMILKGVIHGKTIVLDRDPGLGDGREIAVQLAAPTQAPSDPISETDPPAPWKRWPEELEAIERIQPGEGLRQAAGAWAEYSEEVDEFLEGSRHRRSISREPLEP
jgi:hypothetical protein